MFNDRLEDNGKNTTYLAHAHYYHGRPQRGGGVGGGGENRLPPWNIKKFVLLYGWSFSYLFSMWGPFATFFLLMGGGALSPCDGLSAPIFFIVRTFLLRFSTYGGPFHHVRAFLLPFSPCGGLFCSHGVPFMGVRPWTLHIYYNTVMLKCINIQIKKNNGDKPNTYICNGLLL